MNLKSLHPEGGIKIHKRTNEIEAFECGKVAIFLPFSQFPIFEYLRFPVVNQLLQQFGISNLGTGDVKIFVGAMRF